MIIETIATAKLISARTETHTANGIAIDNSGQYCMALVPLWKEYGRVLMDGTELEEGKTYKITIEVEGI